MGRKAKKRQKKMVRQMAEVTGMLIAFLIGLPLGIWVIERMTSIWYVPGFFTYLWDFYF